jgi:PAS domain S-box-containing protein
LTENKPTQENQHDKMGLRTSQERFSSFLNHSGDGILLTDEQGIITDWNPALERISGLKARDAIGKDIWECQPMFIHPEKRTPGNIARITSEFKKFFLKGDSSLTHGLHENEITSPVGKWRAVQSRAFQIHSTKGVLLGAIIRDISEQKVSENRMKGVNQELEQQIADCTALLETAALELETQISDRLAISESLRKSEERFHKYFELPLIGVAIGGANMRWIALNDKLCNMLGYSSKELENISWADLTPQEDLQSELELYQQVLNEKIEGYTLEKRFIRKDGTFIFVEVSNQCVRKNDGMVDYFMELVQDITQRKEHETELEAVAAVSSALRTAQSRSEMVPIILEQITKVLKTDGAALLVTDPLANDLVVELGMGEWEYLTGVRQPAGEGFYSALLSSATAYKSNNLNQDQNFIHTGRVENNLTGICIPLSAEEQPVGAFWVGRVRTFTAQEERLLTAIANIAANALRRATLHEQTEQRLQRLNILHKIDADISTIHDLKTKLGILLLHVSSQLGVDAADVLTYNNLTREFQYAGGLGFRTHFIEHAHVRIGEGFAGRAGKERQRVSIRDLSKEKDDFSCSLMLSGEGFVTYHCMPLISRGDIKGVLEVFSRNPFNASKEWLEFLDVLAGQIASAIDSAQLFENLQHSNAELMHAYDATIEGWSRALELRDLETQGHSQRVTDMTLNLAIKMGIEAEEPLTQVRRGALLHDIGKMGMPDGILLKQGPLEPEEWRVMRQHPVYAFSMLSPIEFLRPALEIPYCHHERWDGSGYPRGLKGEEIPLEARVFTLVDVWDALTSNRPYRPAWSEEKTLDYIQDKKGKLFDPAVLVKFLQTVC